VVTIKLKNVHDKVEMFRWMTDNFGACGTKWIYTATDENGILDIDGICIHEDGPLALLAVLLWN
jgi:hypothetical protein